MPIDVYSCSGSAHCRAVLLTADALGLKVNVKNVDLDAGEQLKPEFLKLNPLHTVPTIDDNGFALSESGAIIMYLANAYGKNDNLYPKPAKQRALVDHRIFFDTTTLYKIFADIYYPPLFENKPFDKEGIPKLEEALNVLDGYLDQTKYVAGDALTIADFRILATLSTIEATGVKLGKYPKVAAYLAKLKSEIKNYEQLDGVGAKEFGEYAKNLQH